MGSQQNIIDSVRQAPYENFSLYHPDGTLLCHCSEKKARWYVERGLATNIGKKDYQLTFRPNGYGDPYAILGNRDNVCVITGFSTDLTKHHVIPTQFRRQFPNAYKDKNSMDIVLLTRQAHNEYEVHATELKELLYADYDTGLKFKDTRYKDWRAAVSYANTLTNHLQRVPPAVQVFMSMRLDGFKDQWGFTDDQLRYDFESVLFPDPVDKVIEGIGIENLIIIWKMHFIKYGNPKYLPEWWKPNTIKIVTRETKDAKNDLLVMDIDEPVLSSLLHKYDLYETAKLYV